MSALDRAITWVSPRWGASRTANRMREAFARRAYEGAKTGRRAGGWNAPGTSANAEIGPALPMLRARARDLERNNVWARRACQIWPANLVGDGIQPASMTGDDELDDRVDALFEEWSRQCESNGQLSFYGLQHLAAHAMVRDGEMLIRYRPRRPEDGLIVPLQLQMLEADHLDSTKDGRVLPNNAGSVKLGIEFDALDKRRAYWLFRSHPGEFAGNLKGLQSVRVLAEEIIHLYRFERVGQIRGIPWLAAAIRKLQDIEDYHDAIIVKARTEACLTAFVTGGSGGTLSPNVDTTTTPRIETLEPGIVNYLQPGEAVTAVQPTGNSQVFGEFTIQFLMAVATSMDLTYDQLTGDLRQANYSSLRAGKIEHQRICEQLQYELLIPNLCMPVWKKFIEFAIAVRQLPPRKEGYPVEWVAPRREMVDPQKDGEADYVNLMTGRLTPAQYWQQAGWSPRKQQKAFEKSQKLLEQIAALKNGTPPKTEDPPEEAAPVPAPKRGPDLSGGSLQQIEHLNSRVDRIAEQLPLFGYQMRETVSSLSSDLRAISTRVTALTDKKSEPIVIQQQQLPSRPKRFTYKRNDDGSVSGEIIEGE